MKEHNKLIALLLAVVFCCTLVISGCGTGTVTSNSSPSASAPAATTSTPAASPSSSAGDKTEIVIGYVAPFTGPLSVFTTAFDWVTDICLAKINAEGGIYINDVNENWPVRDEIMRDLLQIRPDGHPGILFDPYCPLLIDGFEGGIQFTKKTMNNNLPEIPAKDGWFEHTHEALNYIATGIVSAVRYSQHVEQGIAMLRSTDRPIQDRAQYWTR